MGTAHSNLGGGEMGHSHLAAGGETSHLTSGSKLLDAREELNERSRLPRRRQGSGSRMEEMSVGEKQVEELIRQLEEVTLERDTLQENQERVTAMFETRIRRLQQQLVK
jgi:hypothetical protein